MKKLFIVLLLVLFVTLPVRADGVKFFPKESGILTFYDFVSHSFYLGTKYPLIDWKRILYLDCVTITDFSELNGGLGVSFDTLEALKMTGLTVHLTDRINVGVLGGYNLGKEKAYWGIHSGYSLYW